MPARSDKARVPSQRQLRIGELVRHALAEIFREKEIRDEALAGIFLTVSQVRVSPDGRNATAYVMPLGGRDRDPVVAALNAHAKFIRGELGRLVDLKFVPAIVFRGDETFDEAEHIGAILRSPSVSRDLDNN